MPDIQHLGFIEEIGLDLSGLVQNGADQDEVRLLGIEQCMCREAEATETGRDLVHGPTDAGKVGDQVERPLQPSVVGVGLIGSERFLSVIVNLDKVAFRSFRKAELQPRRAATR